MSNMYEQLAESVGAAGSSIIAKIFEKLADKDEASVLVASSPPASIEELSEKTGLPADQVRGIVDKMFDKGLMFKTSKKDPERYYRVRQIVQFHDSTAVSKDIIPGVGFQVVCGKSATSGLA